MISPAQFIPIAEETGLILPLGEWVSELPVSRQNTGSDQLGTRFMISVNLSSRQFQQQTWCPLLRITAGTPRPPELLELEITETLGMKLELTSKPCTN